MGSKSCPHVAWFKSVPFVLLQQCQEPAFSFLSTSQQFCCFRGVCRGFHLWLTGRAGYWLGEIGSSSYLFSNPVATTLLPTVLETTLISVESSKKTKLGKDVYFGVGKSSCITTSMNPMWVSSYQVWEEISTWFLKAASWKKTPTESAVLMLRHELLPDWKDFRWRQRFPASFLIQSESDLNLAKGSSFIYIKPSRLVGAWITLTKLMTASRGAHKLHIA